MSINDNKTIYISHGNYNPPDSIQSYRVNNNVLTPTDFTRDLGITISSDLSWSNHYKSITSKAYRSLNLIRRTFGHSPSITARKKLYISLVRSQITYCSPLWRPHLIKDIHSLETIQRRATKFILNDYSSDSSDYRSRLYVISPPTTPYDVLRTPRSGLLYPVSEATK